jgi:hypothetical protein
MCGLVSGCILIPSVLLTSNALPDLSENFTLLLVCFLAFSTREECHIGTWFGKKSIEVKVLSRNSILL